MTPRRPRGSAARKAPGLSAEARKRRGEVEFPSSFAALRKAVGDSCARETAWEARIVAGIGAAIDFVLRDTPAARAVTVNARWRAAEADEHELALVSYFGRLLDEATPEMLFPISSPEGLVEMMAIMVRGHLLSGTQSDLAALGPDLIHLTLMPYIGPDEAERWSSTFAPSPDHSGT